MVKQLMKNNKCIVCILTVIILLIFVFSGIQFVKADNTIQYEKSFLSIKIETGDTLTSIAKEYTIPEVGCKEYIEEVKYINNLNGDTIHSGCNLKIPVYKQVSP